MMDQDDPEKRIAELEREIAENRAVSPRSTASNSIDSDRRSVPAEPIECEWCKGV
jgi:hypothetical protein